MDGGREASGIQALADGTGSLKREFAKFTVHTHYSASPGLSVKQRPFGYVAAEHLFKAQCLCAELNIIRTVAFRPAAFIFHWIWPFAVQFHDICHPVQAVSVRTDLDTTKNTDAWASLRPAPMRPFMHRPSLGGKQVFGPNPFNMNQCILARAEQPVLQS